MTQSRVSLPLSQVQRLFRAGAALSLIALAALIVAACGSSSSDTSNPAPAGPTYNPNNPAALSNQIAITSSTASTGTGTMARFVGPLDAYVTGTNLLVEMGMPATATAHGGLTTTLTFTPTVSNLVPYCDVGASSAYSYWVAGPTPGQSVAGSQMTLVITWPHFSNAGTIQFRCSGVLNNAANPATNSAIETTVITATP